MIPAEVIERAREAAFDMQVRWDENPDAPKSAAESARDTADAALRSLLTDLRESPSLTVLPPPDGEPFIPLGEYFHRSVVDALLLELGDE